MSAKTRSTPPLSWGHRLLMLGAIFLHQQQDSVVAFAASPSFATVAPQGHLSSWPLQQQQHHKAMGLKKSYNSRVTLRTTTTPPSLRSTRSQRVTSLIPRGGAATASSVSSILSSVSSSPASLFHSSLLALGAVTVVLKLLPIAVSTYNKKQDSSSSTTTSTTLSQVPKKKKPAYILSWQIRFLAVFWLLRCADWLQGPYFYEVYASKKASTEAATLRLISQLFLTGFCSRAILGPSLGRWSDEVGRKRGTLAFCLIYALGALSTQSRRWSVLFLGRVLGGMGTALLFSAPEAWLVGEAQKQKPKSDSYNNENEEEDDNGVNYLGQTFGWAYAGDSIVAILAGQMAGVAASQRGPTGPFELSTVFLALGGILTMFLWKENRAERAVEAAPSPTPLLPEPVMTTEEYREIITPENEDVDTLPPPPPPTPEPVVLETSSSKKLTIRDAIEVVKSDPKIMLVGAVQSLFEAAMYIFVLQWPPALRTAIGQTFGSSSSVPYGTIFSCFMACCLIGSTLFGQLSSNSGSSSSGSSDALLSHESSTSWMLTVAALAMTGATVFHNSLAGLVAAFFVFEACVGMYFPSIGILRSKFVPDSHRSVIMNLFGIPLNVLVVTVFLSIDKLGLQGALAVSSTALAIAAGCMFRLRSITSKPSTASIG